MAQSDPGSILLKSNRWANENMLAACEGLSRDQLTQTFPMGPGSLLATLTHILAAMRGWGDLLAGREQRPRLEAQDLSLTELRRLHREIADDLEASAASHPHDEVVTGSRGGREFQFTRGAVLTHVTTHGMHHRAQCLNMLRHLGVEKLPPSAVVEWILIHDSPQPLS